MQWLKILAVIAATAVLAAWLYLGREGRAPERRALPLARVMSSPVRLADIQPLRHLTGALQASRKAVLAFEVGGRVERRDVEPGQTVQPGESLLQIESGDYRDALAARQALWDAEQDAAQRDRLLLKLLREEVALQETELGRIGRLGRESLASQSSHDAVKRQLLRLQAEQASLQYSVDSAAPRLQGQESELRLARRRLTRTRLAAPHAGTISAVFAEAGDYVTPGQAAVELVQVDELDLLLSIPAALLPGLDRGQTIALDMDGSSRAGRIVAVGIVPDPDTNTHPLRVRVSGEGLYPGQLARAALPGHPFSQVPVVPRSAVLHEAGKTFVYCVRDGRLSKRPVQLLQRHQGLYVVSGVQEGEHVVTRDVGALADGQAVRVVDPHFSHGMSGD